MTVRHINAHTQLLNVGKLAPNAGAATAICECRNMNVIRPKGLFVSKKKGKKK
jgi:hypothetical protein